MRSRTAQFVCLILLLSSLAGADARAGSAERTPGGLFVRNLLWQAAVEESEPAAPRFQSEVAHAVASVAQPVQGDVSTVRGVAQRAARVHAVTGSGL